MSVGVGVRAYMEEVSDVCASITADGGDGRLCSVFFVFLAFLAICLAFGPGQKHFLVMRQKVLPLRAPATSRSLR